MGDFHNVYCPSLPCREILHRPIIGTPRFVLWRGRLRGRWLKVLPLRTHTAGAKRSKTISCYWMRFDWRANYEAKAGWHVGAMHFVGRIKASRQLPRHKKKATVRQMISEEEMICYFRCLSLRSRDILHGRWLMAFRLANIAPLSLAIATPPEARCYQRAQCNAKARAASRLARLSTYDSDTPAVDALREHTKSLLLSIVYNIMYTRRQHEI